MELLTKTYTAKISDLIPTQKNPRKISKEKLEQLSQSLKDFPEMTQIREIIIDENNQILAGHQRIKALILNGQKEITVKQIFGLTQEQKDEFIIKDNISNGQWDSDILANQWEVDDLKKWGIENIDGTINWDNVDDLDLYLEPEKLSYQCPHCQHIDSRNHFKKVKEL